MFPNSPTSSFLFLPSSKRVLVCDVPHFQAHQCTPPSSTPPASESLFTMAIDLIIQAPQCAPPSSSLPVGESLFVMCHISELMNALLPFPLKLLSSHLCLQPVISATTPLNMSSSPPTASAVTNALNTMKHTFLDHCQDDLQEVFMAPRIPRCAPPYTVVNMP